MRLTADTNILLRAVLGDDEAQSSVAQRTLVEASSVVLTLPALCELCWVLGASYNQPRDVVATVVRRLCGAPNAIFDDRIVAAGLAHLDAGGDFADGAIAMEGQIMGADRFVSFDRKAVTRAIANGVAAFTPD